MAPLIPKHPTPRSIRMANVLLFHHIQGLTPGVLAFADQLRSAGHIVNVPDLFDGRTFDSVDDGAAFTRSGEAADFDALADAEAAKLPHDLVYLGFSWGVMPAQRLAQTRPGARGAVLCESCVPVTGEWAFGPWPDGVPVQIHGMDADPFFAGEGDIDAARELVSLVPDAELFVYPGNVHLFADSSLPQYDEEAASLLTKRVLEFLGRG
ncbi:MAG TPA: dienelactone hydrolase family protein [Lapillicoccus sp.]